MQSKDFAWVVMAIRIQREVGGNLAELLTTVAGTLRERERLRRQVKVLSAEGRLSAWILGLLPLAFALYLVVAQPDYLEPLVTEPLGWAMIALGATLLLIGSLWMRRTVKVEV
jgi:tight adherence protein B